MQPVQPPRPARIIRDVDPAATKGTAGIGAVLKAGQDVMVMFHNNAHWAFTRENPQVHVKVMVNEDFIWQ